MNKILIIAAHPDDEVLGMGGTIAKMSKNGDKIYLLIVTDGSSTQYCNSIDLNEIIQNKKKETLSCAKLLGIKDIFYGNLPDMKLDSIPHITINKVIENIIYKIKPNIVFTHFWGDVNLDHRSVYKSTIVATRPMMGQVVKNLYCYRVPSSTEWSPYTQNTMFMPNIFVDITEEAEIKYDAFSKYSTEIRNYPHPRSVQHIKELDIARGLEVGQGPTETFILLRKLC